jgi:ABC-type glycerol-3-phosphate transport system substrate-binding protein
MKTTALTRRGFIAATATALAAPYVSTAHSAGSLSIGLWDHWVPGANDVATALIKEWGEKEKVDVQIDYITSQGNKLILTLAAENQAKAGHDVIDFDTWQPYQYKDSLENVDDVMGEIVAQNGSVNEASAYTGKADGHWVVVPSTRGTLTLPCCTRFDLLKEHAGIDVQAMYPAGAEPTAAAADWTWDTFLVAAQKLHKAGYPFGLPMGVTYDTQNWVGALFRSFGADLVDASGKITVKTDAVRSVLDYGKRIMERLQQQVADLGEGFADHESSLSMGGGQARCAAGGREVLDARHAEGRTGPLRAVPAAQSRYLEVRQEQVGRQEPNQGTRHAGVS